MTDRAAGVVMIDPGHVMALANGRFTSQRGHGMEATALLMEETSRNWRPFSRFCFLVMREGMLLFSVVFVRDAGSFILLIQEIVTRILTRLEDSDPEEFSPS